jgi:hypothetical protein
LQRTSKAEQNASQSKGSDGSRTKMRQGDHLNQKEPKNLAVHLLHELARS